MKLTFREKAKLFWERNKVDILGWMVMLGITGALASGGVYLASKQAEKEEKEKERIRKELAEQAEKRAQEEMDEYARDAADPANQLTGGGYIRPGTDNLYETDAPEALANCVPLASMGQFGQDIINRLIEVRPNWKEEGYFDPEKAVADVWIDFGHEVWKLRNPEEAEESQEKQAS